MTGKYIVNVAAVWCVLTACLYAVEKPTRDAIVAYNDECKAAGVQADFIAKFGGDFAGMDLSGVDFSGPHAVDKESNLRGANFRGANLRGAFFGAAVLERASFREADLRGAKLVTANMKYVNLLGAQLAGAEIRESDLSHVNAAGVDFANVDLSGSDFPFGNFRGAKFAGAKNEYFWADYTSANLADADLTGLAGYGAQFHKANLRGANLTRADLGFANFSEAELDGAIFDEAKLALAEFRHARGLSDAQQRELVRKSGIVAWERIRMVTSFLDSPWFPLLLVVVIPAIVGLARRLSRRARNTATDAEVAAAKRARFQFTLAGLLAVMFVVAAVVGAAMWSGTGLYSLAMVGALYLMVHPVLYDRIRRRSAARMLLTASAFTIVSGLLAVVTISLWPSYAVPGLVFVGILFGPIGMIVFGTSWAAHATKFSGLAALGFIVWQVGVCLANLWFLAQLFAGV